jgi:hypothetical protein
MYVYKIWPHVHSPLFSSDLFTVLAVLFLFPPAVCPLSSSSPNTAFVQHWLHKACLHPTFLSSPVLPAMFKQQYTG